MEFLELKNILIKKLKDKNLLNQPLKLTLDSNVQYIINKELSKAIKTFALLGREPFYWI